MHTYSIYQPAYLLNSVLQLEMTDYENIDNSRSKTSMYVKLKTQVEYKGKLSVLVDWYICVLKKVSSLDKEGATKF